MRGNPPTTSRIEGGSKKGQTRLAIKLSLNFLQCASAKLKIPFILCTVQQSAWSFDLRESKTVPKIDHLSFSFSKMGRSYWLTARQSIPQIKFLRAFEIYVLSVRSRSCGECDLHTFSFIYKQRSLRRDCSLVRSIVGFFFFGFDLWSFYGRAWLFFYIT